MSLSIRMVIIWRRAKAKVDRLLGNAPPDMRTARESTCPLPYEIVEMIIAHLTHNLEALKACSLTCHSWYIVAVPHLHHTLRLGPDRHGVTRNRLKPLSKLHELGLTSLVREIRVRQFYGSRPWFVPEEFSRRDLRYFSAFTNIQTLQLGELEIYRFIPGIERYFEHFSPTLRSITLNYPRCTPRQLSHFLSLFSNLDNIEIRGVFTPPSSTTVPDTELVPFSAPNLQGRLMLREFGLVGTWTHLIASCGGLRFRYMDLRWVAGCAPILWEACAETLETLRFYATDWSIGKRFNMGLSTGSS